MLVSFLHFHAFFLELVNNRTPAAFFNKKPVQFLLNGFWI